MKFRIMCITVVLSLLWIPFGLASTGNGSPEIPVWRQQISVAVDEYMGEWVSQAKISEETRIEYKLNGLDPRLKLASCDQTPLVEGNHKPRAGKLTLKVSCLGPSSLENIRVRKSG